MPFARQTIAVNNFQATPQKLDAAIFRHGRLRESVDTIEVAAADNDADVFGYLPVWSGWRISEILAYHDGITGGTSFDVGLYDTDENVVDADLFGSAVDLSSASGAGGTQITHESAAWNVADIRKRIWEQLALAADPEVWYFLSLLANTVGSAAGTISLKCRYVDGS